MEDYSWAMRMPLKKYTLYKKGKSHTQIGVACLGKIEKKFERRKGLN